MKQLAPVLRLPHLSFGFLAPLGLLGLIVTWRERYTVWLFLFTLAYCLSIVVFFVVGRYRIPLHPILIVLASVTFFWFGEQIKNRRWRPVVAGGLGFVALAALSHWQSGNANVANQFAQQYYRTGSVAEEQGKLSLAVEHYRQALVFQPCHVQCQLNLGVLLARQGDLVGGERILREAIRCDQTYPKPYFNLGIIYSRQGKHEAALPLLAAATRWDPEYAEAWRAQGLLLAAGGKVADARHAFGQIVALPPLPTGQPTAAEREDLRREAAAALAHLETIPEGQPVTFPGSR
jgi:tetratricopeptide (TPR) repeat protein